MFYKAKQKGFTLIELLIVVTIIGILATMSLASLAKARVKARDVRRVSDLRQIALALVMYYEDNRETGYPGEGGSNQWSVMETAVESGNYIASVPDDPGMNAYEYWVAPDKQGYVLKAVLENANSTSLNYDVDGSVYGCDCDDDDLAYCLEF